MVGHYFSLKRSTFSTCANVSISAEARFACAGVAEFRGLAFCILVAREGKWRAAHV